MEAVLKDRIPVGVLGATGMVGARLVALLARHPWFRIAEAGASDRSAGSRLGDLLAGEEIGPLPEDVAALEVRPLEGAWSSPLLLSALPAAVARKVEAEAAAAGHLVVSNASAFRADPDVPLIIPEVNADHLELLERQKKRWPGGIVTNPNCVVTGLATALAPLHEAFGLERAVVTSLQATSGAGRPGPSAYDLVDNVLPLIPGEEEKISAEPKKILGTIGDEGLVPAPFALSATATRVPVIHGHTVSVSAGFRKRPSPEEAAEALTSFGSRIEGLGLPTAPAQPILVTHDPARPQPRLDRDAGGGMGVTVGRIRTDEVLGLSFLVLAHNLVRGAAGAALLNAELCRVKGLVEAAAERAP